MTMRLTHVTVVVKNQDEALKWYTEKLGFEKRSDDSTTMPGYRWLTVSPAGQTDIEIVLNMPPAVVDEAHKEMVESMMKMVGKNSTWVLWTDDCMKTYKELSAKGVKFPFPPEKQSFGVSAVFVDLYGNPYNLVERPMPQPAHSASR